MNKYIISYGGRIKAGTAIVNAQSEYEAMNRLEESLQFKIDVISIAIVTEEI